MRTLIVFLIRAYRLAVSPLLGARCRFYPTCSSYAEQSLIHHGLWRGGWLSLQRLARCHPWHAGGVDPVPDVEHRYG
ncbi:MAG: membrane protein insertion efficiency factor YidD [Gammaproteobacteria bacterium]|nr:membrane protein insertion efficiency factor YidD [Gammaproteobacteria bacterium]MDH3767068.1 membrane protein insertion efficiency factor YidD [Gammaproteobacteria bacterium]